MQKILNLKVQIDALFVGKVQKRWADKPPSAIHKQETGSVLDLEIDGFVQDSQADLEAHGGKQKALHHYASDHMHHWRAQWPNQASQFVPGCFGENISTTGLTEHNVCLGDIFQLGTATVQISQGRQPCWKLNAHMNNEHMAYYFQRSGRTGWYYRVLETGQVQKGDWLELVERPLADWPLARLISSRFDPKIDVKTSQQLSKINLLSENWRHYFKNRAN